MTAVESVAELIDPTWSARKPQTLVSSLGFSNLSNKTIRSLQDLLRAIQPLQLHLFDPKNLPEQGWLGDGASYDVWKCVNQSSSTKEVVAVKKVKLPKGSDDFEAFQSRVACVLKDIVVMNHPPLAECDNILNLLGYGWNIREGSIPFLVTELAPGRTLRQFLRDNPDTSGMQKVNFCRNVIDGLNELHLVGVIHGDIKLDNVLVVGSIAKISDFGHSLLMTPAEEDSGQQIYRGTEFYNPPEIIQQTDIDWDMIDLRKCDTWALGLLCWEVMRGGVPFYEDRFVSAIISDNDSNRSQSSIASSVQSSSIVSSYTSVLSNVIRAQSALKNQALRYSNRGLRLLVPDFARVMLKRLFAATLEYDATSRLDDVSSLPLKYGTFSECPVSRSQLTETSQKTALWTFNDFIPSTAAAIPFHAKRQMFSDWLRLATSSNNPAKAPAMFHTGLAYGTGFGTDIDMSTSEKWIVKASDEGHEVAKLLVTLFQEHRSAQTSSTSNFAALVQKLVLRLANPSVNEQSSIESGPCSQGQNYTISVNGSQLSGYTTTKQHNSKNLENQLMQAFKTADYATACHILYSDSFSLPEVRKGGASVLHWLFMFTEEQATKLAARMQKIGHHYLNHSADPVKLSDSLPFTLAGTPLSFAIAAASLPTVKILVELGAKVDIHSLALAAKFHLYQIFEQLVVSYFEPFRGNETPQSSRSDDLYSELCQASLFERWLIHGERRDAAMNGIIANIQKLLELRKSIVPEGLLLSPKSAIMTPRPRSGKLENPQQRVFQLPSDVISGETIIKASLGPLYEAIEKAINVGDFCVAKALFSLMKEVDKTDATTSNALFQRTSLMLAATHAACNNSFNERMGQELIKLGISWGGSVNESSPDSFYQRPINVVIAAHREDLLNFLFQNGADINVKDSLGVTPLLQLFQTGFVNVPRIRFFIERGARVNTRDNKRQSVLHLACKQGLVEETLTLLACGNIDVNVRDKDHKTPLHRAVESRQLRIVSTLIGRASIQVNAQDRPGNTPLMIAIQNDDVEAVKLLLECGAELKMVDSTGQSSLHLAARLGHYACLKLLLTAKDNVLLDLQDVHGHTALSLVLSLICDRGNDSEELTAVWQSLLQAGSTTNVGFHWAIETRDISIVKMFLPYRPNLRLCPDTEHRRFDGKTPLGLASYNGSYEIAKLIHDTIGHSVSASHDIYTQKDLRGRSSLHNAIIGLLSAGRQLTHESSDKRINHKQESLDHIKIVDLLLLPDQPPTHNLSLPNITDIYGRTALHYAAMGTNCDPSYFDTSWTSNYFTAAGKKQYKLVKLLLKAGADPSLEDLQGHSSLHYASAYLNIEAAKLMISWRKGLLSSLRNAGSLYYMLKSLLYHPFDQPSFELCLDLIHLGFDPFGKVENNETAYDIAKGFKQNHRGTFIRCFMLLHTHRAENPNQLLTQSSSLKAKLSDELHIALIQVIRKFCLLPSVEAPKDPVNGKDVNSTIFQLWMNNWDLSPNTIAGVNSPAYIAAFGDLLLQSGVDILFKPSPTAYAIQQVIHKIPRAPKYQVLADWLIIQHIRGAQIENTSGFGTDTARIKPLDLGASVAHLEALAVGWNQAVSGLSYIAMNSFLRANLPLDMSLLYPTVFRHANKNAYAPGVALLKGACNANDKVLLGAFAHGSMPNRPGSSLVELHKIWEACTVFKCRMEVVFGALELPLLEAMIARDKVKLSLRQRIDLFLSTLPVYLKVLSPTRLGWMLGLIDELDQLFEGLPRNHVPNLPDHVLERVQDLLQLFRAEVAKPLPGTLHEDNLMIVKRFTAGSLGKTESHKSAATTATLDATFRWSIAAGYINIAKVCLNAFASLGHVDNNGRSVLYAAVECQAINAVRFLLESKLNPGHEGYDGKTAFQLAAELDNVQILKLLCEKNSHVDYSFLDDEPALAVLLPVKQIVAKKGGLWRSSKHGFFSSFDLWDRSHDHFLRRLADHRTVTGRNALDFAELTGAHDAQSWLLSNSVFGYSRPPINRVDPTTLPGITILKKEP